MKSTPINIHSNAHAIKILESALEKVKCGEITSVAVSWVTKDEAIGGDVSKGQNQILMWASLEHTARSFYNDNVVNKS